MAIDGPGKDVFLPVDRFWLCTSEAQGGRLIVRLRSVQISLEHSGDGNPELELRNEDFFRAMDEMKKFSQGSTGRIIGFHASR